MYGVQWWPSVINLGGGVQATILLSPFPPVDLQASGQSPAHPLPNILIQLIQTKTQRAL